MVQGMPLDDGCVRLAVRIWPRIALYKSRKLIKDYGEVYMFSGLFEVGLSHFDILQDTDI